jgi:hypothetical protein
MTEPKAEYKIEGREPTIFRVVKSKDNPYVMIDRRPVDNPELSFKAKGILTYLLSRPDGWEVNVPDLVNHGTDGPSAIRTGLKELRSAGHIHYNTQREGGYIKKWVLEVYEVPELRMSTSVDDTDTEAGKVLDSDFLHVENLQVGNLQIGNRGESILSSLSSNELKQNITPPLSSKELKQVNRKVDAVIEQSRQAALKEQSGATWTGRESIPEAVRELLDVFVQVTGIRPAKSNLMDWMKAGQDWLDIGATQADVRAAHAKSKGDGKEGSGFTVTRPGSLTSVIGACAGERRSHGTAQSVDVVKQTQAAIAAKWGKPFSPPPANLRRQSLERTAMSNVTELTPADRMALVMDLRKQRDEAIRTKDFAKMRELVQLYRAIGAVENAAALERRMAQP